MKGVKNISFFKVRNSLDLAGVGLSEEEEESEELEVEVCLFLEEPILELIYTVLRLNNILIR